MIAELSNISDQTKQRMQQMGTADLVIGLADSKSGEDVAAVLSTIREGLARLSNGVRTAVFVPNHTEAAVLEEASGDESLSLFLYDPPAPDPVITAAQNVSGTYRALWRISDEMNARACAVMISAAENLTPRWVSSLVQPVLERNFDLVTPSYLQGKFDGMLNSAILCPLTRAVYGKQLQNPLGPDFCFSGALVQHLLRLDSARSRTAPGQQFLLIEPAAVVAKLKLCQAFLGPRTYPPTEGDLSSVIAGILSPVFLTIERDAAFWQHIRSSEAVPSFGERLTIKEETVDFDVRRLLESFQLGHSSLQEIWGVVLPPTILLELKKLSRVSAEQFRIPDELWARIVYEFAMAFRLRSIARDHLLRAMTPLYLGWVASYALEMAAGGAMAVQQRLEKLCVAFESTKPYLVSRWRSPDRFNP